MIEGLWAHNLQRTDAPPIRQHRFVWAPLPGLFKVVLPDVVARQRRVVGLQARRAKGRFAENDRADEHEWRESVLFGVDELVDDPLDDRKEAVPAGVARRNQHVHLPLVDSGVRDIASGQSAHCDSGGRPLSPRAGSKGSIPQSHARCASSCDTSASGSSAPVPPAGLGTRKPLASSSECARGQICSAPNPPEEGRERPLAGEVLGMHSTV
eukprot:CAMPEP_0119374290 /NCGR_PEP_ID=MMETSP1334-20130426/30507_1 /TAXON_ID=127549 /ORGANISM="Calcidiscus leptoporus, Strain RCC1130" /LENGTH=210 /DNA_ID=CAMNT_0007392323 /DNA_START=159 /DNA_END=792 /DNA_ORIENTATION=-